MGFDFRVITFINGKVVAHRLLNKRFSPDCKGGKDPF